MYRSLILSYRRENNVEKEKDKEIEGKGRH